MIRRSFFWIGGISAFAAIVGTTATLVCLAGDPKTRKAIVVGEPFRVNGAGVIVANMNSSDSQLNGAKEIYIQLVNNSGEAEILTTGSIDCHVTENWCYGKSISISTAVSDGDEIIVGLRGAGIKIKTNETAYFYESKNCPWSIIGL